MRLRTEKKANPLFFRLFILLLIVIGGVFYHFSTVMSNMNIQKQSLISQITEEQRRQHILDAEWSYLSRPSRLSDLQKTYFPQLKPIKPHQIIPIDTFLAKNPPHHER